MLLVLALFMVVVHWSLLGHFLHEFGTFENYSPEVNKKFWKSMVKFVNFMKYRLLSVVSTREIIRMPSIIST